MWSPSLFFKPPIGFTERKTILVPQTISSLRNFHGLSPWHRPRPVLTSCGDLQGHNGHRQDDCNCGVFVITNRTKIFLGLCNIFEWWRGNRLYSPARFLVQFRVTWFIYRSHRRGVHGSNFLTAVTYSSQSNLELNVEKNNYVPNAPVEFNAKILRKSLDGTFWNAYLSNIICLYLK